MCTLLWFVQLRIIFKHTEPPGGLYLEGVLYYRRYIFVSDLGGGSIRRGLYTGGAIFGILRWLKNLVFCDEQHQITFNSSYN